MYVAVLCVASYWQQTKDFCHRRSVPFPLCAFVDMSFKPLWYHFILVLRVPRIQPVGGLDAGFRVVLLSVVFPAGPRSQAQ